VSHWVSQLADLAHLRARSVVDFQGSAHLSAATAATTQPPPPRPRLSNRRRPHPPDAPALAPQRITPTRAAAGVPTFASYAHGRRWAEQARADELQRVATAPTGTRNTALNTAALAAGRRVPHRPGRPHSWTRWDNHAIAGSAHGDGV
jgi:hypothetical protein